RRDCRRHSDEGGPQCCGERCSCGAQTSTRDHVATSPAAALGRRLSVMPRTVTRAPRPTMSTLTTMSIHSGKPNPAGAGRACAGVAGAVDAGAGLTVCGAVYDTVAEGLTVKLLADAPLGLNSAAAVYFSPGWASGQ